MPHLVRQRETFAAFCGENRNYFRFVASRQDVRLRAFRWVAGGATGDMPPPLRYPDDVMLTLSDQVSPEAGIFDAVAIAAELERLSDVHAGNERELRLAVSRRLKAALADGRAAAERLLIADRHGRRCARRLRLMQDEVLRLPLA